MLSAEEKRLKSLTEKKNVYKQQKNAIHQALLNIDTPSKNKIVFNENDDSCNDRLGSLRQKNDNKLLKKELQTKMTLFDENEDDIDFTKEFRIKEQFEGKKGQKLLELQSKFTTDKRFTLDSRFVENDTGKPNSDIENINLVNSDLEIIDENEKKHQLKILRELFGGKIKDSESETALQQKKAMLRFDPSKPDHSKFEVKVSQTVPGQEVKKKKKKEKRKFEEETIEYEPEVFEASKEKFYKVTDTLKASLSEKTPFSLLSMFGTAVEKDENDDNKKKYSVDKLPKLKSFDHTNNPFKYDSSDSENEEDNNKNKTIHLVEPVINTSQHLNVGIWKESFFFLPDDQRLKDGRTFFSNVETEDKKPFAEVRREIRQVVRAKIKNNIRNKQPFRNKLGGRKVHSFKKKKKL